MSLILFDSRWWLPGISIIMSSVFCWRWAVCSASGLSMTFEVYIKLFVELVISVALYSRVMWCSVTVCLQTSILWLGETGSRCLLSRLLEELNILFPYYMLRGCHDCIIPSGTFDSNTKCHTERYPENRIPYRGGEIRILFTHIPIKQNTVQRGNTWTLFTTPKWRN